jgi:hypothetical protein
VKAELYVERISPSFPVVSALPVQQATPITPVFVPERLPQIPQEQVRLIVKGAE